MTPALESPRSKKGRRTQNRAAERALAHEPIKGRYKKASRGDRKKVRNTDSKRL